MKTLNRILFSLLIALCSLLFVTCSRGADWVEFRGAGGRGVSSSRITPPLGLRWKINLQDSNEIIRSLNPPVVIGNTIYFGSDDGNFYALDVESGYMRWVFRSGAEINSIPYADRDKVYFGSKDGKLYALCRETGQEMWTFSARGQINSQVRRHKDYIIFVGDADAFYFVSPDGVEQFNIPNPGWYNFSFLIYDDVLYFATGPRVDQVGPFDINRREFLWFLPFHEIDAIWYSFPAISGDLLFFGTAGISWHGLHLGYYAFNRHTGEKVWVQQFDAVLKDTLSDFFDFGYIWDLFLRYIDLLDFMAPAVWRDRISGRTLVIFAGGDRVVRAFDAATGELRWEKLFDTPISSAPTIASGRVYFGVLGDDNNPPRLVSISARNGRLLWEMETEGSLLSAPVIAGRRIIFGTDRSVFYVLEQVF